MLTPIILAIDEGTSNAKAVAVDAHGQILARGSVALSLEHPHPGWAEQSPLAVWQGVCQAIEVCLAQLGSVQIAGIAISNQRESVLVWERATGRPLTPIVSWQCRRSAEYCHALTQSGHGQLIAERTGLPIDPLFPAAKIHLLLATLPDGMARAANGELCVGTVDSWLTWQLSGGNAFSTDHSNAARTQLFDIHRGQWDDDLLALFAIPAACLPTVTPSAAVHGYTATKGMHGLPSGIPIVAQVGDSHAALYGQSLGQTGEAKATYGTGSSLMTAVEQGSPAGAGLSTTIAWHDGQLRYALEGNITHTGSGVAWVARMLGIPNMAQLTTLAAGCAGNQGVYFVPALSGLGAPYWDSQARGLFCGLSDAATPAVLCRAALESVAYQIADVFFAMEQAAGERLSVLRVDGGATGNAWLMQFQADLLQRRLIRSQVAEVSALGAAYLGGKTLGWWHDYQQLAALPRDAEYIEPRAQTAEMQDNYSLWLSAVARARFQSE